MQAPVWELHFKVMCDTSDYAVGAALGQQKNNKPYIIYYASYILDETQVSYTMMENEFLAVVFALEKFRSYLINSKVIIFTDHGDLRHKDKAGLANVIVDHLSRLGPEATPSEELPIDDSFLDE